MISNYTNFILAIFFVVPIASLSSLKAEIDTPKIRSLVIKNGSKNELYLEILLPKGSHIYSINENLGTDIELTTQGVQKKSEIRESPPQFIFDGALGGEYLVHKGIMTLSLDVSSVKGYDYLDGIFHYRICNNLICSLPRQIAFMSKISR